MYMCYMCYMCFKPYTDIYYKWCKSCQINNLRKNFTNWSGNEKIDDFIQEMQLKINNLQDIVFEWIPYNQFNIIKKISEDSFINVKYDLAIWKDGLLNYDTNKYEYTRNQNEKVILKCLLNSKNITIELLNDEV